MHSTLTSVVGGLSFDRVTYLAVFVICGNVADMRGHRNRRGQCSVLKTSSVLTLYLGQFTRYWPISIQYRRQIYVSPFTRCVPKVSPAENVSGSC